MVRLGGEKQNLIEACPAPLKQHHRAPPTVSIIRERALSCQGFRGPSFTCVVSRQAQRQAQQGASREGVLGRPDQHVYTAPADRHPPPPLVSESAFPPPPGACAHRRRPSAKELIFGASQTKPTAEPTQTLGGQSGQCSCGCEGEERRPVKVGTSGV